MTRVRIAKIDSVEYALEKKNPPNYLVAATGIVSTGGWNNSELTPWAYIQPPSDGIQDLDFVAECPTGIVVQVLQPIAAMTRLFDVDEQNFFGKGLPLKGFRVHSTHNNVEVVFEKSQETELKTF